MTANRPTPGDRPHRRGGYTFVEVILAVVVLMGAMSVTMKVLARVGQERRAADRRLWAAQEVSNVMERLNALPFDRLTPAEARAAAAKTDAARVLPGAEWAAEVTPETSGPVEARRVNLRLRWRTLSGEWEGPVRLTSWVYRGEDRS